MRIEAIVFDVDGVLFDSFESWFISFNQTLEEFISNILHDNGDEIRKDEVSIVLIIDNFNFHLKDIFCEFLNRKKKLEIIIFIVYQNLPFFCNYFFISFLNISF